MADNDWNGWSVELLREQLSYSPLLELWTIPLYLSAAYSIDLSDVFQDKQPHIQPLPDGGKVNADGLPIAPYENYTANDLKQACFNVLMSVGIQEMFHLELGSNLCNAVGARLDFSNDNAPSYVGTPADVVPKGLQAPTGTALQAVENLLKGGTLNQPLCEDLIDVLIWVEHPDTDDPGYHPTYPSIGTYYSALRNALDHFLLTDPGLLYPPPYWTGKGDPTPDSLRQKNVFDTWSAAKDPDEYPAFSTRISGDVATAVNAMNGCIEAIVEQGEGGKGSVNVNPHYIPTDTQYPTETQLDHLTHYDRFVELKAIWAVAVSKSGDAATYCGKNGSSDVLVQSFSSFLDGLTTAFAAPDNTINLTSMSGLGGRIFDSWRSGVLPSFEYENYETWKAKHPDPAKWHACQGLNACAGQGVNGTGKLAGQGDCAVAWIHPCGSLNNCSQQGGCGYAVDPSKSPPAVATKPDNWLPSANQCKSQGGCGAPIPEKQNFNKECPTPVPPTDREPHADYLGPDKPVWDYARKLFEDRMKAQKIEFGEAGPVNALRKSLSPTTNS